MFNASVKPRELRIIYRTWIIISPLGLLQKQPVLKETKHVYVGLVKNISHITSRHERGRFYEEGHHYHHPIPSRTYT